MSDVILTGLGIWVVLVVEYLFVRAVKRHLRGQAQPNSASDAQDSLTTLASAAPRQRQCDVAQKNKGTEL